MLREPGATNTVVGVVTNFVPVFYTNMVPMAVTNLVARPEVENHDCERRATRCDRSDPGGTAGASATRAGAAAVAGQWADSHRHSITLADESVCQ